MCAVLQIGRSLVRLQMVSLEFFIDQWRTQEFFFGGGVQQIQLRTENRENGDLGAVAH